MKKLIKSLINSMYNWSINFNLRSDLRQFKMCEQIKRSEIDCKMLELELEELKRQIKSIKS